MASGRPGGLGVFSGMIPFAMIGKEMVAETIKREETKHYMSSSGFNLERQTELECWARSSDPEEQKKFVEVYGRPLYYTGDWFNHDAIYFIAQNEGWRYCEPEDRTGNCKPTWFRGSNSDWSTERGRIRATMFLNVMPRQEKYMEWFKSTNGYGIYTPDIFPEDFDSRERYWNAVMNQFRKTYVNEFKTGIQFSLIDYPTAEDYFKAVSEREKAYSAYPPECDKMAINYIEQSWAKYEDISVAQIISNLYAAISAYSTNVYTGKLITERDRASMKKALLAKSKTEGFASVNEARVVAINEREEYYKQYPFFEKYKDNLNYFAAIDKVDCLWLEKESEYYDLSFEIPCAYKTYSNLINEVESLYILQHRIKLDGINMTIKEILRLIPDKKRNK